MHQLTEFPSKVNGAHMSELFDGGEIAVEALGECAKHPDSGLVAFAYLWRRFGPPWLGTDDYKSLVSYNLSTSDEMVFLRLNLSGSPLHYAVSYLITNDLQAEADAPYAEWEKRFQEWWLEQHPDLAALENTRENRIKVMEAYSNDRMNFKDQSVIRKGEEVIGKFPQRPDPSKWREDTGVCHRINKAIFDALVDLKRPVYVRDVPINIHGRIYDDNTGDSVERSEYAGYGVPKEAMDDLVRESKEEFEDFAIGLGDEGES